MKKTLFALMCIAGMTFMSSCGNSSNKGTDGNATEVSEAADGESLNSHKDEGYSLTFKRGEDTVIYTVKGSAMRMDFLDEGGYHRVDLYDGEKEFEYDGEAWNDDANLPRQSITNYYGEYIQDLSKYMVENGYQKTGTIEICGKTCDVYSGDYNGTGLAMYGDLAPNQREGETTKGEIAVWNGVTLRYALIEDGQPVRPCECTNIRIGIPDTAFTKVLEF